MIDSYMASIYNSTLAAVRNQMKGQIIGLFELELCEPQKDFHNTNLQKLIKRNEGFVGVVTSRGFVYNRTRVLKTPIPAFKDKPIVKLHESLHGDFTSLIEYDLDFDHRVWPSIQFSISSLLNITLSLEDALEYLPEESHSLAKSAWKAYGSASDSRADPQKLSDLKAKNARALEELRLLIAGNALISYA